MFNDNDTPTPTPVPPPSASASSWQAPAGWERATLEKLAFASLNEQKAARRWKLLLRFIWVGVIVTLMWLVFFHNPVMKSGNLPIEHTAVVEIRGEIASGADANAEAINTALKSAFEEDAAKGVILLINSPGGSPVQAGMISDEIKRLKAIHKKPVVAVVEESAASAAYYIAVAADTIYVNKASIVGSIGVLMDGFGFTGLMEKIGVERRLLTAGENKGFLDPFSPQTDKQRTMTLAMLDQIHQQFIGVVREGRGKRLKETPETFSGLFWVGQQAVALGLADGLGSTASVARDVIKSEELVDYTRRDNVAERLVKRFGASIGEGAVKAMGRANTELR